MNIDKVIQTAREYHRTGNLDQAEPLYKKILEKRPKSADVLLLLGILNYERRQYDTAIQYLKKTIQADPRSSDAYYNLANAYAEKGLPDEAITYYQKAIEINPHFTYAYNNLGITLHEKKQYDEAVACFRKSTEIDPQFADAYYNLGTVYQDLRQYDLAVSAYQKALQLNPQNADACFNLGTILEGKGLTDEAISLYQRAQQLDPHRDDVYFKIGKVFKEKQLPDKAIAFFRLAVQMNPLNSDALVNLGAVLRDKGSPDEAILCYRNVLAMNPEHFEAHNNLGVALSDKGLSGEAIPHLQRAVQLNPRFAEAYNNLGSVYRRQGMLQKAATSFETALSINPALAEARNNLGTVLEEQGRLEEAEFRFRQALTLKPNMHTAYSNLLLLINYSPGHDASAIFSEHIRFAKLFAEPLAAVIEPFVNDRSQDRRLRIGYCSPDFRRHAVAYFIEPVLAAHNREDFEIFCYSNSSVADEVTRRIREYSDQWRSIVGMSDEDAATLIRNDKIDILIDLTGHTGNNRILLFARKPAPIQVSWIGYLATTGLPTIDYKIVDGYTDPPGKTEQFHTEKLIRLPESFLCYLPDKDSPEVGHLPARSTGHITFGSFNNFAKVTPEVFTLWARVLNELPESRLILKGKSFADETTCQYAINMFTQRGISAERITLQPWNPSPKHFESYNQVDIALDTFPFNGATTTCEAMWMGVPVITLEGTAYHSRAGVSLLSNVGLPKLIATTHDEYIGIAVNLASDIEKLQLLRESLRDRMLHSPLTDARRFTANLEQAYRQIWKKWCTSV